MNIDPRLVDEDAMKGVVWTGAGDDGSAPSDDADDVSEADSDYLELQADIARLDASRHAFLAEHLGPDYDDDAPQRKKTRRRGPRKAAEPTGEVKLRLQEAHQLFMDTRYEDALASLHEIIRVNAETHAAWSLMASINEDLGRREEAMMAKLFAAHLEPKNTAGWLNAADYALESAGLADDADAGDGGEDVRMQSLQLAQLCYSGAIRADKDSVPARLGKANVCLEFGQATNAATEYVRVLKRRPLALQVVRNLAEASYDSVRGAATIRAAIDAYRRVVEYLRGRSSDSTSPSPHLQLDDDDFSWMDVTIYVELYASLGEYKAAVALLKSLARWMLGRGGADEAFWDDEVDDDAEWDRHDDPRRRHVTGFQPGRFARACYGEGLPVDLRAKLAVYRLKLGHEDEAMEHLSAWLDPQDAATTEHMRAYPHLLKDVGAELFAARRFDLALQYLELYRDLNRAMAVDGDGLDRLDFNAEHDDAEALVLAGKCSLELHDHGAAEEAFLAAIDADDENIDARFELAKMYEQAQAKEQAFILVNEALSLEAQRQHETHDTHDTHETHDTDVRRRPMASLETGSFRVFFNAEGKVVRRRRKFRKGPDGQDVLITAEQRRLDRARMYGDDASSSDDDDGLGLGVAIRPHPPGYGGAGGAAGSHGSHGSHMLLPSQQRQLRTLRRQHRREMQAQMQKTHGHGHGHTHGHGGARRIVRRRPRLVRRLFASPAEQAKFEADTSARLRARYSKCQEAKARAGRGDADAAAEWMDAAKELIDDFRSFREFYTWDKYVSFLGGSNFIADGDVPRQQSSMSALAERLQQHMAPAEEGTAAPEPSRRRDFRGIPFDDWLALFLEYALGLAHAGRTAEAYAVCQSAHDSTVYRQEDSMFLIHLAWASCAVRAGDEETCVAVARYFMRDRPFTTDCFRLFATMCRLSRAPLSTSATGANTGPGAWFSSSPAQKYILRQIRQRDDALHGDPRGLDTCLLVVYGHILFASTSYHFALNYYQRALAVDPANPAISMCIGLAYVHWALKRQAENRQYLVAQGLNFLYRYADARTADPADTAARREAYYNLARTYHLLGLHALAADLYRRVLQEGQADAPHRPVRLLDKTETDLRVEAAYNLRTYYLLAGNTDAAMHITRSYLVL